MTSMTELVRITKMYGHRTALRDVSITVAEGEIVGLIGPNAAGKTTILRVLAGLIKPSAGCFRATDQVRYFGGEQTMPGDVSAERWARATGSANPQSSPKGKLGVLSRGTRQRIGLEATLADADGRLILLDEPWESLDPDASRWLSSMLLRLRDSGAGLLVSSHRIHDLADVCDRCEFLIAGRIRHSTAVRPGEWPLDTRAAHLLQAFDHVRAVEEPGVLG